MDTRLDTRADLGHGDAVALVAASVRRLFPVVSERRARDVAASAPTDLRAQGVRLVQDPDPL